MIQSTLCMVQYTPVYYVCRVLENLLTKYLFTFRFRLNDPIAPYIRSFSSEVDIYKINRKVIFDLLAYIQLQ